MLHQIWLGPKPLPDEFKRYSQQWAQCHSGWEMKLWTSSNLPKLTLQDEFNETPTWSGKSDILRMELIYQFGGVYVDTDFECFLNIEPLIRDCDIFATLDPQAGGTTKVGTALFGAVPNHPIMREIIRKIPDAMHDYAATGPAGQIGPGIASGILDSSSMVLKLPTKYTHPYGSRETHREKETFSEAYCIHRWAKSWVPPKTALSFIVACHNNREQIERTIPTMINHVDSDYVLVDWNSEDGSADWVEKTYPQARVLRINSSRSFDLAYAMNIGSGLSGGTWQCFLHPGTSLRTDLAPYLQKADRYYVGSCPAVLFMCPRAAFFSVGGFDDLLMGGYEDLRVRLAMLGLNKSSLLTLNPDHKELDNNWGEHMSRLRSLYTSVKCDLLVVNSEPVIPRGFRNSLYCEIGKMCQKLEETWQDQAFEVDVKAMSIRPGFQGKDSVQLCRTMKYVLKY